tara:strand:+ start:6719 stop:7729 length:1011 start_codon:yes stop_codon:yes gene_type:complete
MYKFLLLPFAIAYWLVIEFRYLFYRFGLFKSHKFSVPIISVGNIVVGGAGKTPCILSLVQLLKSRGKRVAVVYRGYKRLSKEEVLPVQLDHGANHYGDEAYLCKFHYPDIPVYVGAKRADVIRKLLAEHEVDVVLMDDAFQHLAVQRDVDICLIDASEIASAYKLLPLGRMREPWRALKRASDVVVSKTNFKDSTKALREHIFKKLGLSVKLTFAYEFHSFCPLEMWIKKDFTIYQIDHKQKYHLVSGIAKPAQLLDCLEEVLPKENLEVVAYADHYAFSEKNLSHIQGPILVSEKDAIKIMDLKLDKSKIFVVRSKVKWNLSEDEVYEHFHRQLS